VQQEYKAVLNSKTLSQDVDWKVCRMMTDLIVKEL
jgi:hypothetical protein